MANLKLSAQATRTVVEGLNRIRLRRNLTYDQMAPEVGLSRRALFKLLNERRGTVHDRTLEKARIYLERQAETQAESAQEASA
jgi:AraC-like DNA-binding protein